MSTPEQNQEAANLLDELLDKQLSDVEDLPEYLDQIANGFYKVKMVEVEKKTVEVKQEGTDVKLKAPVVQFVYEIMECLELQDPSKKAPNPTDRFNESVFFHKDKEKAAAVIKAKFGDMSAAQGWVTVLDIINGIKGLEFTCNIKTTADKDKADKFYLRVTNCQLA